MRILLLGEFSALHKYLKEGLENIGHEVDLASDGDRGKDIDGQTLTLFEYDKSQYKVRLNRGWHIYKSIKKHITDFEDYDIVQMIHPIIFPTPVNYHFIKKIKEKNGTLCLACAGLDYANALAYKNGRYRYYAYDYEASPLNRYFASTFAAKLECKVERKVVSLVDKLIPYCWQYYIPYEKDPRCTNILPMPININTLPYIENVVRDRIVILHGLNREKEKGTPIIREALERVQQRYPNKVEVIIDGHMPLRDYQRLMSRANIVIDQCTSGGYGMGTLQAMALGKVVCADCWPEFLAPIGITPEEFPGIIISNTSTSIYEGICKVIERGSDYIRELGHKARIYAEQKHDYKKIADNFLSAAGK